MNFEIVGKLLERTVSLSGKLQCEAKILLAEIYLKGLEVMEGVRPVAELSEEEKDKIASKPEDSHQTLAASLHKPNSMIKSYRLKLAEENIRERGTDELDATAAKRFGLNTSDYQLLRIRLGFLRIRGVVVQPGLQKIEPCELGTIEEIRYALTEGGQDITGIVKAKGLDISRERGRQIIAEYGMNGNAYQRKPLWYAHKLVGLDKTELARNLIDKDWVKRQLARSGGLYALASKLAVHNRRLKYYLHKHLELKTDLERSHGQMVELKCSFCHSPIWRLKSLVEKEKKTHPDKKKHFCNKICQGKWLGELRRKKGKKKKQPEK